MKKKLIIVILLIQILFNFSLANFFEVSAYEGTGSSSFGDMQLDPDEYQDTTESGTSNVGNNGSQSTVANGSVITAIGNAIFKFLNIIPSLVRLLLMVGTGTESNLEYGAEFSIQKAIFGQIEIFDVNYFNRYDNEQPAVESLKNNVAIMFTLIRNIAIVLNLIILIYSGIRMAISTLAQEKAKYKNMIMDWLFSFILLMTIQFVMVAVMQIVEVLNELLISIYMKLCGNLTIETTIISDIFMGTYGLGLIVPSLVYWIITFYQLKFAYMYFKRVLSVGFLIVISPLVISSYSFDRAGDGEAQAIKAWLQEFVVNLVIQPVHILLFSIFFITAENIVNVAPVLSIVLIVAMTKGEKVIKNILRIRDVKSMESMEKSSVNFDNVKKAFHA